MDNKVYITAVLSSAMVSLGKDKQSKAKIDAILCSKCGKKCKDNSFCRYMFNELIIRNRDIKGFMDAFSYYVDNHNRVYKDSAKFRRDVCDKCSGCVGYYSRVSNVHCTIAWYDQNNQESNSYTTVVAPTHNEGPISMCSNGLIRMFNNGNKTRDNHSKE